jgi:hypothetical protein
VPKLRVDSASFVVTIFHPGVKDTIILEHCLCVVSSLSYYYDNTQLLPSRISELLEIATYWYLVCTLEYCTCTKSSYVQYSYFYLGCTTSTYYLYVVLYK